MLTAFTTAVLQYVATAAAINLERLAGRNVMATQSRRSGCYGKPPSDSPRRTDRNHSLSHTLQAEGLTM